MTMTTLPVFTYGTLRPGGALHGSMPGRHIGTGTIHDADLYIHATASFPVCDTDYGTGSVRGDVFHAPLDRLGWVAEMEFGAGYDPRWRTVRMDDGTAVTAIVFHWPWVSVGAHVPSGDWLSDDAMRIRARRNPRAGFATRHTS